MTTALKNIKTVAEDINDELASLRFDIDHKYHSSIEHFNLLQYMDELKRKKAELETRLKYMALD